MNVRASATTSRGTAATRNIQRLEAGQNLTLYTPARLAAALGVSAADLVGTGAAAVRAVSERRRPSRRKPS